MEPVQKLISHKTIRALYRRYKYAPINPLERLVIYLRLRLSSYEIIESYVPSSGQVLDLGCGFGMFSVYLAISSRARVVRGVDISHRRLQTAKFVSDQIQNVVFERGDILEYAFQEHDCILLIDSLHYFPASVQNELLKKCFTYISPGGRLLLKNSDKDNKFRHLLTEFHETIMTKSGFTEGDMLCFRGFTELGGYLENLGFFVDVLPMWNRTPFADTLLVCTKTDN
ncbi:MAG: class I SAM-dependent methyltransferase [Deltaproteobacteria bacterium]|nr:class I SAM-dependent methyltransferase [Deltaproteobacteria bacterium]